MKWYELALELGLPLQVCQRNTTSTEFVKWQKVLTMRELQTQRQDWLLARLCWEIRRSSGEKNLPQVEDLLITFTTEAQRVEEAKQRAAEQHKETSYSEQAWNFFFASAKAKTKPPLRVLKFPKAS